MLNIKDVTKTYGNITAVDHLNLNVEEGAFFGLLGPNGAGKTTLIRMISTLTPMTSGVIEIDGFPMDRNLVEVKERIGVVPQYCSLEPEMTAWQNLELHGRLYGMPKKERRERIDELLAFTDLTERKNNLSREFSGGMQRKLMIARALMHHPSLLLLDEPTVGLDAPARRKIWDLLKQLNSEGLTILLTTHYIEEAETLCSIIGLIDSGKVIRLDTPQALICEAGNFVLEYFRDGRTCQEFYETREKAISGAKSIEGSFKIREANLEDAFIRLTNKRLMEGRL